MNNEEVKQDIKEFNHLRDELRSLNQEVQNDAEGPDPLLTGDNRKEFVDALENASQFVDSISGYFDGLARQQMYYEGCDFSKRRSKRTRELIKAKKEDLDFLAAQHNYLWNILN